MTYAEIQANTPVEERVYYVYMWYTVKDGEKQPFYIGCSKVKSRCGDKSNRSNTFKEFVRTHDCYSTRIISHLAFPLAIKIEQMLKEELKARCYAIIDAEEDMEERRKRQSEGIARARARGVKFGRPQGEYPDFQKFFAKQKDGLITVKAACEAMGISRSQWYKLAGGGRRPQNKRRGRISRCPGQKQPTRCRPKGRAAL